MVAEAERADAVWYPESDEMGEHELQRLIAELLRPLLERWLKAQGRTAHAGADQFFYWQQGDPSKGRAPDLYVIEGLPQDLPEVGVWKTWEGHRPTFALELCGDDWQKDYDRAPLDYDAMGAAELIIFDRGATPRSRRRVPWQVFRRTPSGAFERALSSQGDRVWSQFLGCHLREVNERGHRRIRLATGDLGSSFFPTEAEAEHRRAEQERSEKLAAHLRAEVERARAEALGAEVERLKAALERLTRE